jgi:hypothetical protein
MIKEYSVPQLVEYGSLEDLVLGGGGTVTSDMILSNPPTNSNNVLSSAS